MNLTPKRALFLFILLVVFLFAQSVWWVVFMARLADEKVSIARQLGASPEFVENLHQEERSRQIMIGMEGSVFLLLIPVGIWLIYRSLARTEELKFHQQNFLMAVTHELKTPLASINIYLDSLQSEKITTERKLSIIPRMKEDVGRLTKLVDNVLEAGRFDRSGYNLKLERFDLTDLVKERVGALEKMQLSVPLEISHQLEEGIAIKGDRVAMRRAIDAMLENSLKYRNLQKVIIHVSLSARNNQPVLQIVDNGIGLEKQELKAIFNRFYRVGDEMTHSTPGSGLGLYLCREIVKAHKGDIRAHSEGPGKGTRLTVTFKRKEAVEDDSTG